MSTHLDAHLVAPSHLADQVDIFLHIAEDAVDSGFDSDFDDFRPEILRRSIPDFGMRTRAVSRRPVRRTRGMAEVAAEASRN